MNSKQGGAPLIVFTGGIGRGTADSGMPGACNTEQYTLQRFLCLRPCSANGSQHHQQGRQAQEKKSQKTLAEYHVAATPGQEFGGL